MRLTADERNLLIERYENGPALIRAAYERVPAEARKWKPAPDKWSAHEVICHCADSESNGSLRVRYVVAEREPPTISGYDEHRWSVVLNYDHHPVEAAFAVINASRANTVPLLRTMPEELWTKEGIHTERGKYTAEDWLEIYAGHLEVHTRQIERNLAQWNALRA